MNVRSIMLYTTVVLGVISHFKYKEFQRMQKIYLKQIKYDLTGSFIPPDLRYVDRLVLFQIMNFQRYREYALLKLLGTLVQRDQLHYAGAKINNNNKMAGPRIETDFDFSQIQGKQKN